MNPSEEIEHYLNGFDLRMYEWMKAIHSKVNDAVQQQIIEEFATKLAQHRALYLRPPPHRRGQNGQMPKFDAFIRIRDNITKILQNRIRKDHIMFDYHHSINPSSLFLDRHAILQMMKIMETIGIEIDYPGVREMRKQKETAFGFSKYDVPQVQKLLDGTVNITEWEYCYLSSTKRVEQELSRESCIGKEATDKIMANLREFVWFLKQEPVGNVVFPEHENVIVEITTGEGGKVPEASCWSLPCSVQ